MNKKVVIYSTPTCHFCHAAKDYFAANSVAYTDYNVAQDMERRKEVLEKSGQMGVPVIFIDDQMVIGFNKPKLAELLNIKEEATA